MPPRLAAALWSLVATLTFSLVYSSGKLIDGIVPAFQIVLIRYASGFVVALIAARATGHTWREMFMTERRPLHFLRALCARRGTQRGDLARRAADCRWRPAAGPALSHGLVAGEDKAPV